MEFSELRPLGDAQRIQPYISPIDQRLGTEDVSLPRQSGRKMYMRERLRKGKAEQERRAQQAARRAQEILSVSSSKMRKAEREPREAVYRAEMLKWRIEGGGLRPRRARSLAERR
jgi:hypothetical protein